MYGTHTHTHSIYVSVQARRYFVLEALQDSCCVILGIIVVRILPPKLLPVYCICKTLRLLDVLRLLTVHSKTKAITSLTQVLR